MDLRPLPRTDLRLSLLGLGTVKLGRATGVKYPHPFDIPDDHAALTLLDTARALGINTLDTAPAYGTSEERLGALLDGRRDEWAIITKAGEEFDGRTSRFDFTPAAITTSLERSLRRLRTDRVEILLIHSDGQVERHMPDELWATLHRLRDQGKVRVVGLSPKTVDGARLALPHADVLMLALSPADRSMLPVIADAARANVGVLIKKALASGHADPAEALRLAAHTPGVTSIIVGTINPHHLRTNAHALDSPSA